MKSLKKLFMLVFITMGIFSLVACGKDEDETPKEKTYTYKDYAAGNPDKWNPHTWETNEDSYIMGFVEMGLYDFVLNSAKNGYDIIPEMAAAAPVDVTQDYLGNEVYGVPNKYTDDKGVEVVPSGYAWKIALNPNACWQNGVKINADTYLYSMEQLLSPKMLNYRADSYYSSNIILANAENYYSSDAPIFKDIFTKEEGYKDIPMEEMYFSLTNKCVFFGDKASTFYQNGYASYFQVFKDVDDGAGGTKKELVADYYKELVALQNKRGYGKVTPEVKVKLDYIAKQFGDVDAETGEARADAYKEFCFWDTGETTDKMDFSSVGIKKTGEYEITLILGNAITEFFLYYSLSSNWLVYEPLYEAGKTETAGFVSTNYGTSVDTTMAYGPYKLTGYQEDKQMVLEKNDKWYGYTDGKHVGQYQTTGIECSIIPTHATALLEFLKGNLDNIALDAADMDSYRSSDYIVYTPQTYTTKISFNTSPAKLLERQKGVAAGTNKTILANADFRKAFSLALNRDDFAASCTASASAGYGLLNYNYVSNPDTGELYRDTEQGKGVLKKLYGLSDVTQVTGFDKVEAAKLFQKAYEAELASTAEGHLTATDKIEFEFLTYKLDDAYVKMVTAIQKYVNEATVGTGLEGKIYIKQTADDNYYDKMQAGECEMIMSTWGGNPMNPFAIVDCYCNKKKYFEYGYDTTQVYTIKVEGQDVALSLEDWNTSLNQGTYATAAYQTKLDILAALELKVLSDYCTLPLYYRTSAGLDSQRIVNGTDTYVQLVGFGGIRFITYKYDDAAWDAYCKSQGNKLTY